MKIRNAGAVLQKKIKEDKALNLRELAVVSGYDRGTLARMMLPLIHGKLFYTDFRRILSARQDAHEANLVEKFVRPPTAEPHRLPAPVPEDDGAGARSKLADKFYFVT